MLAYLPRYMHLHLPSIGLDRTNFEVAEGFKNLIRQHSYPLTGIPRSLLLRRLYLTSQKFDLFDQTQSQSPASSILTEIRLPWVCNSPLRPWRTSWVGSEKVLFIHPESSYSTSSDCQDHPTVVTFPLGVDNGSLDDSSIATPKEHSGCVLLHPKSFGSRRLGLYERPPQTASVLQAPDRGYLTKTSLSIRVRLQ
jgi:hypothetical protein